MIGSFKRQLLSNLAFIFLFSFLFAVYGRLAVLIFDNAEAGLENTAASSDLSEKLILLDAGHGCEDGGTVGVNGVN